ncbi:MAG TPA: class I SAM-dependent methyltransferase [Bryobacteraceae bacterium]|nr:class I SAM-dependent methyltransferase [Bryobacteraceae bacterium]
MTSVKLGSEADFERVRQLLLQSDYTSNRVVERFDLPTLGYFDDDFDRAQISPWHDSAVGILIRLFIELHRVDEQAARQHLDDDSLTALQSLGLLTLEDGMFSATSALYPTGGVWIASDLWQRPDRQPFHPGQDVVYSALVANAFRFLTFMPRLPAEAALDLCCGTGVAALSAAKQFAQQAYATDIAERSIQYAEFNRRLNGLENVTLGVGDLYEPVRGKTFDRIYVHPPYVPVLRPKYIYHDGGEDGESISRRIVTDLPQYLRPGGMLYMLAMLTDREQPTEQRLRQWLGESAEEFDVTFWTVWTRTPEEYAVQAGTRSPTPLEDIKAFKEMFDRHGVKSLAYGNVYIQRHRQPREAFTIRRNLGQNTGPADIRRVIQLETLRREPGGYEQILNSRVSANLDTELRVHHKLTAQGWEPGSNLLITTDPFPMEARVDLWAPYLLAVCLESQTKTVREIFRELQEQDVLPQKADPIEFAQALSVLVSGGFLSLEIIQ